MLSVILSSFNEADNEVFWANLNLLRTFAPAQVEVRVVDGGSTDETVTRAQALLGTNQVVILPHSERGARYNLGIESAGGELLFLVHPRSRLPADGVRYLLETTDGLGPWGAFRHSFDWDHPLLKFTSWYSNFVRGRGRAIFYLDHCLYFKADLKAHARFPALSLFEDTHFCYALRRQGRPRLLPFAITTAAVRFRKNGVWRQSAMNQTLKLLFHLGVSEKWMNKIYEKGLSLNVRAK